MNKIIDEQAPHEIDVDELVDRILGLYDIRSHIKDRKVGRKRSKSKNKGFTGWEEVIARNPLKTWIPKKTVIGPDDRLFSIDPEMTFCDTDAIIRLNLGAAIFDSGIQKWVAVRSVNKPQGFTSYVNNGSFFELHYRHFEGGSSSYVNKPAVHLNGSCHVLSRDAKWLRTKDAYVDSSEITTSLLIHQQLIEDCASLWVAEVSCLGNTIVIGTYEDRLKELIDLRDGPLSSSGKRSAVLHWVKSHIRNTKKKKCKVSQHPRGIQEIDIEDYHFSIAPPVHLLNEHKHPERFAGHFIFDVFNAQKQIQCKKEVTI